MVQREKWVHSLVFPNKWSLKYTSKHMFHDKTEDKTHGSMFQSQTVLFIYLFTFFKLDQPSSQYK